MEVGTVLDVATLTVVSVGGFLLSLARSGFEARVKSSAEEGAKIAVKNANWVTELKQELEKTRGAERQELRFKSYGRLWAKLRPLAIYETVPLNQRKTADLMHTLSDWYFSEDGGLMLTAPVREFYFALQDLLRTTAEAPEWRVERPDEDSKHVFESILADGSLPHAAKAYQYFAGCGGDPAPRDWPLGSLPLAKGWRDDVKKLAARWTEFNPIQKFAVLQQVGSTLRSSMTCDVESRFR
jgi:hypothetical protein